MCNRFAHGDERLRQRIVGVYSAEQVYVAVGIASETRGGAIISTKGGETRRVLVGW
jgi:hypothetical protein